MIHTNQLYLVTDKTIEKLWTMADAAVNTLNDTADHEAAKDAVISLLFDMQELIEDIDPIPGIEGLDRVGHKPAIPVK